MEHEEYTRDNYPTSGKKYNGEKAIISLTSWRARINTVDKTIYSLIKQCPGFHIVLVLSEEEFPKMMDELPTSLKTFVDNELIEVLWVYKNYRSFKKVLFTMDKYNNIPVISADDDCIYAFNYAQFLYDTWTMNKSSVITSCENYVFNYMYLPNGCMTLYFPHCLDEAISVLSDRILATNNDDMFYGYLLHKKGIDYKHIHIRYPQFHDEIEAMGATGKYSRGSDVLDILKDELK